MPAVQTLESCRRIYDHEPSRYFGTKVSICTSSSIFGAKCAIASRWASKSASIGEVMLLPMARDPRTAHPMLAFRRAAVVKAHFDFFGPLLHLPKRSIQGIGRRHTSSSVWIFSIRFLRSKSARAIINDFLKCCASGVIVGFSIRSGQP